jgi:site-specific DNA-methyltransferase (adenine-specific)
MTDATIEQGDAFDLLEGLPEGYAHAAVIDFPWTFSNDRRGGRESHDHSSDWDMAPNERFAEAVDRTANALVDGGWLFAFADDDVLPEFRSALEGRLTYRKTLIWDTEYFGMGHYYRGRHQYILAATVGDTDRYVQSTPTVFRHTSRGRKNGGAATYPTEKPPDLYRDFLEEPTERGERLLEPFCGSAPGLAAAKALGLDYWGCDVATDAIGHAEHRQGQQALADW